MADYDIAIIGGGINGSAIARDAAGRGLKVLLVEQNDLASGTSSTSTKLIHGGLRYLEQGALRLVRESLIERSVLLKTAPHIIWPMRFILPHHASMRPALLLRFGLFIYDLLSGNGILPKTKTIHLKNDTAGTPLQPLFKLAFEYSDCSVDDARLVVLNCLDAAERGATILTRTKFDGAMRKDGAWNLKLKTENGSIAATAGVLVNAAGPWIEDTNKTLPRDIRHEAVKLVKGSHIVVPKLFDHNNCYIFQNKDGRIVFAVPYEHNFTLIGTTEVKFSGEPATATASDDEIRYLCNLANTYFVKNISEKDVVWSFAGIRALYDSRSVAAKDLSRDYLLKVDDEQGHAPLLSIYGGKLTSARRLAEIALDKLKTYIPIKKDWTGTSALPGGDFSWDSFNEQVEKAIKRWPFLDNAFARRLVRAYGTRLDRILGHARSMNDLGIYFGANLTQTEVDYLIKNEWAKSPDDILWRRSKLGLHLSNTEQEKLAQYMSKNN